MDITDHPLHRSGRAGLPHPAPALGDDAKSLQGIGVTHADLRQVAVDQAVHSFPQDAALLAAATERSMPESRDLESETANRLAVHGHGVITHVPLHDAAKPLAHLGDRMVKTTAQFEFDLREFGGEPLAHGLAQDFCFAGCESI